MFIWDFLLGDVMDQIIDWFYGQLIGFLADFFAQMGNMGVGLFDMSWVQSIVLFFSYLAWSLYGTIYSYSADELPTRAKTVYMYLKDRSDAKGECWPAINTIARETSMSRSTVKRGIADLVRCGLLTKEPRYRENRRNGGYEMYNTIMGRYPVPKQTDIKGVAIISNEEMSLTISNEDISLTEDTNTLDYRGVFQDVLGKYNK